MTTLLISTFNSGQCQPYETKSYSAAKHVPEQSDKCPWGANYAKKFNYFQVFTIAFFAPFAATFIFFLKTHYI